MAISDQQLRAITYLAVSCRPHGARQWDEHLVYAALASLRTRSLAVVTEAAVRAAADRDAEPTDLPRDLPQHWSQPVRPQGPPPRRRFARGETCGVCAYPRDECRSRWEGDHDFVPLGYRHEDQSSRAEALASMRVAVAAAQVCQQ